MIPRRLQSFKIRQDAAQIAKLREHPTHISNGEEFKYRNTKNKPTHIANYTKGLPHNTETGLLLNSADYQQFVLGIQSGDPADFVRTPLGPGQFPLLHGLLSSEKITRETVNRAMFWQSQIAKGAEDNIGAKVRAWESAGAGLVFDLEGPDAQSVTMPPAPTLDSVELAAEMAEVYLQALLRDTHFSQLRDPEIVEGLQHDRPLSKYCQSCSPQVTLDGAIEILNQVSIEGQNWFNIDCCQLSDQERKRNRSTVNRQNLFRGITPGDDKGPYLSQFLLIGNSGVNSQDTIVSDADGLITYGSIRVDQRVRVATPCKDYMTTFEAWVDVQDGADVRGLESYVQAENGDREFPAYRFITTPRDLATYVHYDALYEAYLNACLILLGMGAPFDPGIPFQNPDVQDKQQGFAHFGGPQILSLVCEVATRALKAVRFQKFNIHRRLRPEALAGLIDRYKSGVAMDELEPVKNLVEALNASDVQLLNAVAEHNQLQNLTHADRQQDDSGNEKRYLLPMAFPEGSPMHPSYGAGHATVAGACVTMLKAFFDHGWELNLGMKDCKYVAYEPNADGSALQEVYLNEPLTVEGELNKIAANISIGRDWAGVHYFTDYIESLRLGEQIAIGILEEQKLTYGENFTMTIPLFDGGTISI